MWLVWMLMHCQFKYSTTNSHCTSFLMPKFAVVYIANQRQFQLIKTDEANENILRKQQSINFVDKWLIFFSFFFLSFQVCKVGSWKIFCVRFVFKLIENFQLWACEAASRAQNSGKLLPRKFSIIFLSHFIALFNDKYFYVESFEMHKFENMRIWIQLCVLSLWKHFCVCCFHLLLWAMAMNSETLVSMLWLELRASKRENIFLHCTWNQININFITWEGKVYVRKIATANNK